MEYNTISAYIGSKKSQSTKIDAIDKVIDSMLLKLAEASEGLNPTIDEYQLDDGQVKIRTKYRSIEDIKKGIKSLEELKQMYVNRHNGHITVLRDVRGLH